MIYILYASALICSKLNSNTQIFNMISQAINKHKKNLRKSQDSQMNYTHRKPISKFEGLLMILALATSIALIYYMARMIFP